MPNGGRDAAFSPAFTHSQDIQKPSEDLGLSPKEPLSLCYINTSNIKLAKNMKKNSQKY
jgi:hypothetical protein